MLCSCGTKSLLVSMLILIGIQHGVAQPQFVPGWVMEHYKISNAEGGFPDTFDREDAFGSSVAILGDLDDDGVDDLAVGARRDDDGGQVSSAVYILFLNPDRTLKAYQKIFSQASGLAETLNDYALLGYALTAPGDLDGDGVEDLIVGAPQQNDGGTGRGAVFVLFLNQDGTVKRHQVISSTRGNFSGALEDGALFGKSVASLGDLDGDDVSDLAVGAPGAYADTSNHGTLWILYLQADGRVKTHRRIASTDVGFDPAVDGGRGIGESVARIGDLNQDGMEDIAVGSLGEFWIIFFNNDGTVKAYQKISTSTAPAGRTCAKCPSPVLPWTAPPTRIVRPIAQPPMPRCRKMSLAWTVYPTPFTGQTTLSIQTAKAGRVRVDVYDLLGRQVTSVFDGLLPTGQKKVVLDGRHWPAGMYVVRANGSGKQIIRTIVHLNR